MTKEHKKALEIAREVAPYHIDDCGDVNMTSLAEEVALKMDREEWLDDSDHFVWEIAFQVYEEIDHAN